MLLAHQELAIDTKKAPEALSDKMVDDLQQEWVYPLIMNHITINCWLDFADNYNNVTKLLNPSQTKWSFKYNTSTGGYKQLMDTTEEQKKIPSKTEWSWPGGGGGGWLQPLTPLPRTAMKTIAWMKIAVLSGM